MNNIISKIAILSLASFSFATMAVGQNQTSPSPSQKGKVEDKTTARKKVTRLPFRGTIHKIDEQKKMITLKGKTSTRTFQINSKTKLVMNGKKASFSQAKVGEIVGGYAERTDKKDHYLALSLRLGPKRKAASESRVTKPKPDKPSSPSDNPKQRKETN